MTYGHVKKCKITLFEKYFLNRIPEPNQKLMYRLYALVSIMASGFVFLSSSTRHAVYVSVIEIEQTALTIKVFKDDLHDAIRSSKDYQASNDTLFCELNREAIESYFQQQLQLIPNGRKVEITYAHATAEGDSYWLIFSFQDQGIWQTLEVTDTHFMELFPSQTNIIKLHTSTGQHFCRLNATNPSCQITLED